MQQTTLVIMAAGLGSRYGSLKQITPIDDKGHLIIDYSIFDAVRAGFDQVVCILKPEMAEDFREAIGDRLAPHVNLTYAFQSLDMLPAGFSVPEGRTKPWGTAHAVLCAKDVIHTPFAVINADDFYGATAFSAVHDFLVAPRKETEHAMVAYRVENTLSESGAVARGVCDVSPEGYLTGIVERTHVEPRPGGAAYTEDGTHFTFIPNGTVISMNIWGFQPAILGEIERRFSIFLRETAPQNPLRAEYFLPAIPNALIDEGKATVRALPTDERWYGLTYREDMPRMHEAIEAMRREGVYPQKLWG